MKFRQQTDKDLASDMISELLWSIHSQSQYMNKITPKPFFKPVGNVSIYVIPPGISFFEANDGNIRTMYKIRLKSTIKTPQRR